MYIREWGDVTFGERYRLIPKASRETEGGEQRARSLSLSLSDYFLARRRFASFPRLSRNTGLTSRPPRSLANSRNKSADARPQREKTDPRFSRIYVKYFAVLCPLCFPAERELILLALELGRIPRLSTYTPYMYVYTHALDRDTFNLITYNKFSIHLISLYICIFTKILKNYLN